jgi:predicted acylesterase/phospholipase RssA
VSTDPATAASEALSAPSAEDADSEIRIALVLYGGVSLAIYIYGVVYEFWRLVRASRGLEQNAYTPLLGKASAIATVDIISGASAGGINGVLLGKALATGANLDVCRSIWVDGGDFAKLLRDPSEHEPRSLLRVDLFDQLLRDGLDEMDRLGNGVALVDVLDVFTPATRLRGWVRTFIDDFGQSVQTRQYRKVFNLKFRRRGYLGDPTVGYDRNDFGRASNPSLVEIARATSAFPFAFEPKLIARRGPGDVRFTPREPDAEYFSDGGILHNRPFTQAVSTIVARAADRPVQRWLLSVEPDPEHFAPETPPGPNPEVVEVVGKALSAIPRYESIAADLDRLQAQRTTAEEVRRLLEDAEHAFDASLQEPPGPLGAAYTGLKRRVAQSDLVERLLRCAGLEDDDRPSIDHGLIGYAVALGERADRPDDGFEFVDEIDLPFRLRRVEYLLGRVGRIRRELLDTIAAGANDSEPARGVAAIFAPLQRRLWALYDAYRDLGWHTLGPTSPAATRLGSLAGASASAVAARVQEALAEDVVPSLRAGLATLDPQGLTLAEELEAATHVPFAAIFKRFGRWDEVLLPLDRLCGTGERVRASFGRISPLVGTYIRKPAAEKVAGDALGHFGGFIDRDWRRNDILWGRLDAAEVIVRVLLAPPSRATSDAERDAAIHSVQEEAAAQEIPDWLARFPGLDYRTYLEQKHTVGAETLADVPMQARANLGVGAAQVFRNMLRRLQSGNFRPGLEAGGLHAVFRLLGTALGFALFVLRWPVRAVWGRDTAMRRLATLVLFVAAAWAVVTLVLVGLDIEAAPSRKLWGLIGLALVVFLAYVVLLGVGMRARYRLGRHRPPSPPGAQLPPGLAAYAELEAPAERRARGWAVELPGDASAPRLSATLRAAVVSPDPKPGAPVPLAGAVVTVRSRPQESADPPSEVECELDPERPGGVEWTWAAAPASAPGLCRCQFPVVRNGGTQTVPTRGFVSLLFVEPALSAAEVESTYADLAPPAVEVAGAWSLTIKRGDTLPSLHATLRHPPTAAETADGLPGRPLALRAPVSLVLTPEAGGDPTERECLVEDAAHGTVRFDWSAEDTATAGSFRCVFVEGATGGRRTIPSTGFFTVLVAEPLSG